MEVYFFTCLVYNKYLSNFIAHMAEGARVYLAMCVFECMSGVETLFGHKVGLGSVCETTLFSWYPWDWG